MCYANVNIYDFTLVQKITWMIQKYSFSQTKVINIILLLWQRWKCEITLILKGLLTFWLGPWIPETFVKPCNYCIWNIWLQNKTVHIKQLNIESVLLSTTHFTHRWPNHHDFTHANVVIRFPIFMYLHIIKWIQHAIRLMKLGPKKV